MSVVRYLLDEHVDSTLRAQLLRHAPDLVVWIIGNPGAPKRGTLDPDLLLWEVGRLTWRLIRGV